MRSFVLFLVATIFSVQVLEATTDPTVDRRLKYARILHNLRRMLPYLRSARRQQLLLLRRRYNNNYYYDNNNDDDLDYY
ncbi:unnamed protein product [Nippostrongylus brasiliensis]|uniref:Uncharacterized protein n=1 Tax=Nippostrongylus brasiliensis TaxID=27835 RepID=A0A0N4YCD2_NIPBR|nr:unnamed protein product [Nippostrongylus brasiliensis]